MEIDYHQKNESRDGNKGQPTRPGPPTVSPTAPSAVLSHFDSYNFNFQNLSSIETPVRGQLIGIVRQ